MELGWPYETVKFYFMKYTNDVLRRVAQLLVLLKVHINLVETIPVNIIYIFMLLPIALVANLRKCLVLT